MVCLLNLMSVQLIHIGVVSVQSKHAESHTNKIFRAGHDFHSVIFCLSYEYIIVYFKDISVHTVDRMLSFHCFY